MAITSSRHRASAAPPTRLIALDLMPGDDLELERGRRYEHVVSVTRHDWSRTIDCQFESGRRGTFQYKADLMIAAH